MKLALSALKSNQKGASIMKKIAVALALCAIMFFCSGCTKNEPEPAPATVETKQYITTGRYYANGSVITKDGNVWDYQTDTISDKPAYDNEPVHVVFDDNGTETIYDDAIIGLVLDMETAIYDKLEAELSSVFEIERDGNNIRIITQK
jgi:hypothetical protein